MSNYKPIPEVETRFSKLEIGILIQHFHCKTVADLIRAAKRYESLFFMFDPETHGVDLLPGDHMELALALAEHCVFENFRETDQVLKRKYPKRRHRRRRNEPLPATDIAQQLKEAKKLGLTNEAAMERLKSLGKIPLNAGRNGKTPKPRTILRYLQKYEKERREANERAVQAFKDVDVSEYLK